MVACERADESTTPSIILPSEAEPTTTSTSGVQAELPPPAPKPAAAKVEAAPPEPVYEDVQLMTRAGPKWIKRPKEPVRVRRIEKAK